ncbi:MAG: hypothetical protein NWF05_09985 [Candidatus Bathyarchaeota archaeon]|nr:hypothetical protein [Candidatus Bathyarchaeota archaeon]
MKHPKLISLIVMLTIFGGVAGICWALVNTHQPTDQLPTSVPNLTIPEQVRDDAVAYIAANHVETAQFMDSFSWTGGRVTPEGLLGGETYMYQSQGWNVTITYPVVVAPVYDVTVDYSTASDAIGIPYHVTWEGIWQDGCVTEASYVFVQ